MSELTDAELRAIYRAAYVTASIASLTARATSFSARGGGAALVDYDDARYALKVARKAYHRARAAARHGRPLNELKDAKVAFLAAKAAYEVASRDFNRKPGNDYSTVHARREAARAELETAHAAYDKARANAKEGDR